MTDRRKLILVLSLEFLMILLVVVTGLLGLVRVTQQEDTIACQQRYISTLSGVLAQRAAIGNDNRAISQAYSKALSVTAPGSPARTRAYAVYSAGTTSVNARLDAMPIPGPSTC